MWFEKRERNAELLLRFFHSFSVKTATTPTITAVVKYRIHDVMLNVLGRRNHCFIGKSDAMVYFSTVYCKDEQVERKDFREHKDISVYALISSMGLPLEIPVHVRAE